MWKFESKSKPKIEPKMELESEPKGEPESQPEAEPEPKMELEPEAEPEPESKGEPESQPKAQPEPKQEQKSESKKKESFFIDRTLFNVKKDVNGTGYSEEATIAYVNEIITTCNDNVRQWFTEKDEAKTESACYCRLMLFHTDTENAFLEIVIKPEQQGKRIVRKIFLREIDPRSLSSLEEEYKTINDDKTKKMVEITHYKFKLILLRLTKAAMIGRYCCLMEADDDPDVVVVERPQEASSESESAPAAVPLYVNVDVGVGVNVGVNVNVNYRPVKKESSGRKARNVGNNKPMGR